KVDEGFLVGYSVYSKAFRVFNSRIRIVQETLHVNFMENKSNVAGSGPTWLFDIDSLSQTMNYHPVLAENQTNSNAGFQDLKKVKQKKDGIFISQDKYIAEILRKFGLSKGKSASTPIDAEKPLLKDSDGENVDVHTYRSMIGYLMYLTSSRPDIMFAVCACARLQMTLKVSHLNAIKRIFRYLKGKPLLGLWYPKDSPFDLVAYSDSDYAGASLYKKSTTGGCQFLGCRLIFWQCKKQTVVATSSIKAEYVAVASGCTQVLWMQNQLLDYGASRSSLSKSFTISSKLLYACVIPPTLIILHAFLYGTIEEEVYVCQPPWFEDPENPNKVYKVVKALYGLHQAHRVWYETLDTYLLEIGFQRGIIDQTLFNKKQQKDILLVQIYVDDIIFGATNKALCKSFEKLIKDKFQISSMGELTFFLGLQVKQKKDGIFISYDKYVAEILRKFGLSERKSASTSIDADKPLLKDLDGEDVDGHTYRLISWQCKKQTVVATSSTEAEYVAVASGCCSLRNMAIEIVILNILSDALTITTNGVQLTMSNP
nr:uncharacterized mitochondrial protein AtMg00810-like [Tanacetum cinerariifolium]